MESLSTYLKSFKEMILITKGFLKQFDIRIKVLQLRQTKINAE